MNYKILSLQLWVKCCCLSTALLIGYGATLMPIVMNDMTEWSITETNDINEIETEFEQDKILTDEFANDLSDYGSQGARNLSNSGPFAAFGNYSSIELPPPQLI